MSGELISAAVEAARPYGMPVLCHISSADELEARLNNGAAGAAHAVFSPRALPSGIERRMAEAGFAEIPTASLCDGWRRYSEDPTLLEAPFLDETLSVRERQDGAAMTEMFDGASLEAGVASVRTHPAAAREAGVMLVAGTDTGNLFRYPGHGLHEELAFYVSAGLTPLEALATATIDAARLVHQEGRWGSVRVGRSADLVVLDSIDNTRSIRGVIRAGRILDRTALPVQQAASSGRVAQPRRGSPAGRKPHDQKGDPGEESEKQGRCVRPALGQGGSSRLPRASGRLSA